MLLLGQGQVGEQGEGQGHKGGGQGGQGHDQE